MEAILSLINQHWVPSLFGLAFTGLTAWVARTWKSNKAVKKGVEALLADRLIQLHNYYYDKGYCPTYARNSAEAMYNAYHNLGGNGTITDIYEGIKDMPLLKKEEN